MQLPIWSDAANWNQPEYYTTFQCAPNRTGAAQLLIRSASGILVNTFNPAFGQWQLLPPGPDLTDAQNWNQACYYSTIQYADIDGDGWPELVARSPDGIVVWRFNPTTQQWTQLPPGPAMSDAGGWNAPEYYSTIQCADINGDGRAEIVGRFYGGIFAWTYDPFTQTWNELAQGPDLSDPNGWSNPAYYSTIQCADINGDGKAELIARSSSGLFAWGFDRGHDKWIPFPPGPKWADSEGWLMADSYGTIRCGDINGDHIAEIVARSPGGMIVAWAFDVNSSTWNQLPSGPDLHDAQGWSQTSRFSTIQLADYDGDGRDELLIRGSGGIVSWKFQADQTWSSQTIGPPLSDAEGWSDASCYSTIRFADIDNDGRKEMIARGPDHVVTYDWQPGSVGWVPASSGGCAFPQFNGDQLSAYQCLSNKLMDLERGGDIRSQYSNAAAPITNYLQEIPTLAPCTGISQADWGAVTAQITTELEYVNAVNGWFQQANNFISYTFESQAVSVESVSGDVQLEVKDQQSGVAYEILSIFANVAWAIMGGMSFLGTETVDVSEEEPYGDGVACTVLSAVFGVIASAASAGASFSGGDDGTTINTTVAELQSKLNDWFSDTLSGSGCVQKAITTDWGLLQAYGLPIQQGALTWDDTLTGQLVSAGQTAYQYWLFQLLMPLKWVVAFCNASETPFKNYPAQYSYYDGTFVYWLQDSTDTNHAGIPAQTLFDALFGSDEGCLGVPVTDVLLGNNGWALNRARVFCQ
jgi:hypothetical protein